MKLWPLIEIFWQKNILHKAARLCILAAITALIIQAVPSQSPTYEQAVARWPDMERPIAFLGLKDHPDEFAVMWNGNLSLDSATLVDSDKQLFSQRQDKSLQVSFSIGQKPGFRNRYIEDNTTRPSLVEGFLPIAQIRHETGNGVLLQEVFASNAQGGSVAEWNDPVFLWVRFTVEDPGTGSDPLTLWAQLAADHTQYAMRSRSNVRIARKAPGYPYPLKQEGQLMSTQQGKAILWASHPFRYYPTVPEQLSSVALAESQLDQNLCEFGLPRKTGASLELLIPFLPISPASLESARQPGYSVTRQRVEDFWRQEVARGVQLEVPEREINHLWKFHPVISFITADSYPNGDLVMDLSPHHYEAYWPTPTAMHFQALAQQGYFEAVRSYLEPFRDAKRRRPVPNTGSSFAGTEGFISGPSEHVYISWVSDHGALLWTVSEYYLLTRDREFLDQWLPSLLAGLEWVAREREQTRRSGGLGAGLMPAGRATDDGRQSHFVWSDAWVYRGVDAVCAVLESIDHPQTQRWKQERDDYRTTFQKRFRNLLQRTARWIDPQGVPIPFVPYDLRQHGPTEGKIDLFYVDTGPLFLGVAGLLEPASEIMTWTLKWFTEGPYAQSYDPQASEWFDPASLPFEMSSGEPCYSWNIPLRFLRGEQDKFLEGFYSLAAGSVSRRFLGGVEHRDGIQGVPVTNAFINNNLRNILVFENLEKRSLEILRNAPPQWLEPGKKIAVGKAPSYYGPISYQVEVSEKDIRVQIEGPSRESPETLKIHLPHGRDSAIRRILVNGQPAEIQEGSMIEIITPGTQLEIVAEF